MTNSTKNGVSECGINKNYDEYLTPDETGKLALKYRDEMLKDLGVVGVRKSSKRNVIGERIRKIPVESIGSAHNDTGASDINHRLLTDVSEYEHEGDSVANSDEVNYLTIRFTTGPAARFTSATTGLGWETIPTPREIYLAEYLESISKRDVKTDSNTANISETIIRKIFPTELNWRSKHRDIWLSHRQTNIDNVMALDSCISGLVIIEGDEKPEGKEYISQTRYRHQDHDFDNDISKYIDTDGPLRYRLSTHSLIHDHYFDNPKDKLSSDSWDRVFVGAKNEEVEEFTTNGCGFISIKRENEDGKKVTINTYLVTIPEMKLPEHVLDIPKPEPRDPTK